MHLILVGINHKTASIDLREKLYFPTDRMNQAHARLCSLPGIDGCVILSTCNRTEVYASTADIDNGIEAVVSFLEHFHNLDRDRFYTHLYRKHCEDAVSHLFKVAASLDSMVVGEYEIQGQVRNAYSLAHEGNFTNNLLNKLFQTAIQAGKTIRSSTGIGRGTVSVASVAIELVCSLLTNDSPFQLLIIGAGKMASLTAQQLVEKRDCRVSVMNRSRDKAQDLARAFRAQVIDFDKLYEAIVDHDIVIVSTSAPDFVIQKTALLDMIGKTGDQRRRFFIDLSVPRNVDPTITELDNNSLYSVDDLHDVISSNIDKRYAEISKVETIIEELSSDYYQWYAKQKLLPVMKQIKQELGVVKDRILASHKNQLTLFDPHQTSVLNQVLDDYSEKLIKIIMKNLSTVMKGSDTSDIARELSQTFTIDEE